MGVAGSAGYRPSWRQSFLAPAKLIIVVCIRHAYNTTKTLEELKQLETAELNAMGSVMSKVCTYSMPHGWLASPFKPDLPSLNVHRPFLLASNP